VNAFEQLRHTDTGEPIAPDQAFAARLRARLTAALLTVDPHVPLVQLPDRSLTMTTTEHTSTSTTTTPAAATLVPYLSVADAAAAIDWYIAVLDAVEMVRYVGDDGRIGHAEIAVGGARLMLADEYPEYGIVGPGTLGGTSFSLNLDVDDVDAVWARAIEHGADGERPPTDEPYGERKCTFRDPSGHRWSVQTMIATPTPEEITAAMGGFMVVSGAPAASAPAGAPSSTAPVELGYFTLGFTDTAMASRFYRELFGWQTEQGNMGAEYAHVANTQLPLGFTPDGVDSPPVLYFRVADAQAYAAKVRDLGGTVVSEATYDSGGSVVCRDDQGREFQLWQPAPGY
jgi:uncharacterized glyoxalase superfamily protein PhnB